LAELSLGVKNITNTMAKTKRHRTKLVP
jgi:hypothetical protein